MIIGLILCLILAVLRPFSASTEIREDGVKQSDKEIQALFAELAELNKIMSGNLSSAVRDGRTIWKLKKNILIKLGLLKLLLLGKLSIPVVTVTVPETITSTRKPAVDHSTSTTTAVPMNNSAITCYNDNELIIAIDSSGSVGSHYKTELQFAAKLASRWRMHSGNRVGVFLFSDIIQRIFGLEDSPCLTVSDIENMILNAPYDGSGTAVHLALDEAGRQFLDNSDTSTMIPRNMVVVTDGISDQQLINEAAERLYKIDRVRGFSVGVGEWVSTTQLLQIAGGNKSHVFVIDDFDHLLNTLRPLTVTICDK